jgi:cytochrome c biogenesis factor
MTKILILIGVLFILVGLLYPYLSNLGLGKLHGDIKIEKKNFNFYFPITTSIVLSIIISLLFKLFSK